MGNEDGRRDAEADWCVNTNTPSSSIRLASHYDNDDF